jgi:hypothetical protein
MWIAGFLGFYVAIPFISGVLWLITGLIAN